MARRNPPDGRALGSFKNWRRQLIKKFGRHTLNGVNRMLLRQSHISSEPVIPKSLFPWLNSFENEWRSIRQELDAVLVNKADLPSFHDVSPDQSRISRGDNWKVYPLYVFGEPYGPGCERCPNTARLLSQVPGIENAMFSILAPRYHIPAHCGPTSGIVRVHLGLIVPQERDKCQIRVDDKIFGWEEGRCEVFDDHFEHEVWNRTDEMRVVLFFDFDRPLKAPGRLLNRTLLSLMKRTAYVKDMHRNLDRIHRTGTGF